MKQTLMAIAMAALVAAGLSFGLAHWITGHQRVQSGTPTLNDVTWLKRELRLNDSQVSELAKYEETFQEKFTGMCAEHCDARRALGKELAKPQPDAEKARACVERMNAAQAESERLTLEHILKVRAVLSDEQARRYGKLVCDQVCSMLPGGTM